ncbi:tyrosine-type recombinase/integrase [Leucobacter sp. HY1910]
MAVVDRWMSRDKITGKKKRTNRYGKGMRWLVQFNEPTGARVSNAYETKDEADAAFAKAKTDIAAGTYLDPAGRKLLFKEYARRWQDSAHHSMQYREDVQRKLNKHILPYFENYALAQIRPSDIQGWLGELARYSPTRGQRKDLPQEARTLASSTRAGIFGILHTILDAAVDDQLIGRNPCGTKTVKQAKPARKGRSHIQVWSRDRIQKVQAAMGPRWRPSVDLGAGCGMRRGEILAFDPYEDINWEHKVVTVKRQVIRAENGRKAFSFPKYQRTRSFKLPEHVAQSILSHLERFPAREVTLPWGSLDGPLVTQRLLLTTKYGNVVDPPYFGSHIWSPACRSAGFEPTRAEGIHVLRHSLASHLLASGAGPAAVAEMLGHAHSGITMSIYSHTTSESRTQAGTLIDDFWS